MKVSKFVPQIKTENKIQTQKGENALLKASVSPDNTDRVDLSTGSQDVQKMREILQQTPDIRTERVSDLKERIERGEYRPAPQEVADRMLAGLLSEDLNNI
jgi:negative regulator of flagellin synthesis FlgM